MDNQLLQHRLLIISNNVLSSTRSNGKVILSYFDCLPKEMVRQLYFSSELPSIAGYNYFQISDKDILRGIFKKSRRGREISSIDENNYKLYLKNPSSRIKTPFFRLLRELLWARKWKSDELIDWLDDYCPTDIFFVGGDSIFAYSICLFVKNRFNARLSLYLTDDYILEKKHEGFLAFLRRRLVKAALNNCLKEVDQFFTISSPMKDAYKKMFNKDSFLVTNMTEPIRDRSIPVYDDRLVLMYAGSLYYGRDKTLRQLAEAVLRYNKTAEKKALLKIYTNLTPTNAELNQISVNGASEYCGRLSKDEVAIEMNRCHILCIVESFDEEQIEKTRLSLSTKASEYMSVGKPILAIGPSTIGTMDYLSDVAICITNSNMIDRILLELLRSEEKQQEYGDLAFQKYIKYHVKEKVQIPFICKVLGEDFIASTKDAP